MSLVAEFESAWSNSETPPDVFQFLKTRRPSDPRQWLAIIQLDQRFRWRTSNPLRAEDYLAQLSDAPQGIDWTLQIAIGELQARSGTNKPLQEEEISQRFPQIHDTLKNERNQTPTRTPRKPAGKANPNPGEFGATLIPSETHEISGKSFISALGIGTKEKGRYRIDQILGEGAFGLVYLGFDSELHRQVAIKVPTKSRFVRVEDANLYLSEARTVASLNHPHIVPVFDVGRTQDGSIYVVSRYIEGQTLADWAKERTLSESEVAELLILVARALQYAHEKRLIHRDIKPANILIESATRTPFVTDFGLAIKEEDYLKENTIAGTPAYMSPEQARGEGHRLDARSDIFSLGVVLYELLTKTRPFRGKTPHEILRHVVFDEPSPPQQLNPRISPELERICLKALSKKASDRYSSAAAMADDLAEWVKAKTSPVKTKSQTTVIPRGLRSFGSDDADFFLDLLPGPRNRDGLPESISFWKQKIEQQDSDKTFSVGLLYGPSGCGKSSLFQAGLLPHLSSDITAIYLEATPDDTELRIHRGLRKRFSELPENLRLVETFAALRRAHHRKTVIILDQFEQWLQAHPNPADSELCQSLRQCDGTSVQAIVLVRDDFAMPAVRLMDAIDVPLVQGHNFATVDLFDESHARKVLIKLGQAYGQLPTDPESFSSNQSAFVNSVASSLARHGKVVSVRLSLFAEMVKDKPWTPSTLIGVGGTEGIGLTFLEDTLGTRATNPKYRLHQHAARNVLKVLLPELGSDLKGHMRSHQELFAASGYQTKPSAFSELLRILDSELRLITPTSPEGLQERTETEQLQYYQLTHDYLVPSLREWLTRKQRETKQGRAELKLSDRAASWGNTKENRQLPTLAEWLSIRLRTNPQKWTQAERQLMKRSDRYHVIRSSVAAVMCLSVAVAGLAINQWITDRQIERDATNLVRSLQSSDFSNLSEELGKIDALRSVVEPKLKLALAQPDLSSEERIKLSLALLPSDQGQIRFLYEQLLRASPNQLAMIIANLEPHAELLREKLWTEAERSDPETLLRAAAALARYAPTSARWAKIGTPVSEQLVKENALYMGSWIELLRPAAPQLVPGLQTIYVSPPDSRSQTEIDLATNILEVYAANDFQVLHELIVTGQASQFAKLFDEYETFQSQALEKLRAEVATEKIKFDPNETLEQRSQRIASIQRRANAAVALARLRDAQPLYDFLTVDKDPEALSQFVHRLRGRDVSADFLIRCFDEISQSQIPTDPVLRDQLYARMFGFLLGLGECSVDGLPEAQRNDFITRLAHIYGTHPSRAVHSAAGWLLRRWGELDAVKLVDETPLAFDESGQREWYVLKISPGAGEGGNPESSDAATASDDFDPTAPLYFTMLVFPAPIIKSKDSSGSAEADAPKFIAVSDREVTWRQFSAADSDSHRAAMAALYQRKPEIDEPAFGVNWFEAVAYCRWLSSRMGLDEDSQSYPSMNWPADNRGKYWITLPANTEWPLIPNRPGFRLLQGAEWRSVARGKIETPFAFGSSDAMISDYVWHQGNSEKRAHAAAELRPTIHGLYDMHGNLWEWTADWHTEGTDRLTLGGGWINVFEHIHALASFRFHPYERFNDVGFRLALNPTAASPN